MRLPSAPTKPPPDAGDAHIPADVNWQLDDLRLSLEAAQTEVRELREAVEHVADNIRHHRTAHEQEWVHSHRIYMAQTEGVLRDVLDGKPLI